MDQLQKKEVEHARLVDAHHKSVCDAEKKQKKQTALEETIRQMQSQINQLNREVETKSDLVCVFWYSCLHFVV